MWPMEMLMAFAVNQTIQNQRGKREREGTGEKRYLLVMKEGRIHIMIGIAHHKVGIALIVNASIESKEFS